MKKLFSLLAIPTVIGSSILANAADAAKPSLKKKTMRINDLILVPDSSEVKLEFSYAGDLTVSSGQPKGGVTSSIKDKFFTITVEAGRHSSPDVYKKSGTYNARHWAEKYPQAEAMITAGNFVFSGEIGIDCYNYSVVIMQYCAYFPDLEHNYWRIGGIGDGWTSDYSSITTPDGRFTISPVAGHMFTISANKR